MFYRVAQDQATLQRVSELITISGYSPSLGVIITWSEATLFSLSVFTVSMQYWASVFTPIYDPQVTFQVVLSTDGERSFVTFLYDSPVRVKEIVTALRQGVIGFDAGDLSRSAIVFGPDSLSFPLAAANSFRIDGMH